MRCGIEDHKNNGVYKYLMAILDHENSGMYKRGS